MNAAPDLRLAEQIVRFARVLRAAGVRVGPGAALIEYGSGAGIKVRTLLDAMDEPVACVPIDISGEQLQEVAATLERLYPRVAILPVQADYTLPVALPELPTAAHRVAFFPGSTIGNFEPHEAEAFLKGIRSTVGDRGSLILGVDRRKDPSVILPAYNDSQGVTAAFNRNVLIRLNRELGADFDVRQFDHRAIWNDETSCIEMHLVSRHEQVATVDGIEIHFDEGESIWTESSCKYDEGRLENLVTAAGFRISELWTDSREFFWVAYLIAD